MPEVVLRLACDGPEYVVRAVLPDSTSTCRFRVPRHSPHLATLRSLMTKVDEAIPHYRTEPTRLGSLIPELGRTLWKIVFGGERQCLADAVFGCWVQNQHPDELRLLIASDTAEPLTWPWEYLCRPEVNPPVYPIAAHRIRLIRLCEGVTPRPAPVPPVSLSLLASSPTDRPGFNTLWCHERAGDLAGLLGGYAVITPSCTAPTAEEMIRALRERHVVVFIGHGEYDCETRRSGLVLVEPQGGSRVLRSAVVDAAILGGELARGDSKTSLVVLVACNSAQVTLRLFEVARCQIRASMPSVVAMQFLLPVDTAFDFLQDCILASSFRKHEPLSAFIARWRQLTASRGDLCFGIPTMFAACDAEAVGLPNLAEYFIKMRTELGPCCGAQLGLDEMQSGLLRQAAAWLPQTAAVTVHNALATAGKRKVDIGRFAIDVFPVTNRLYRLYAEEAGLAFNQIGLDDGPALVTLQEARNYCSHVGGRLPTPEEWEYAARQACGTVFPGLQDNPQVWGQVLAGALPGPRSVFDSPVPDEPIWPRDMLGNVGEFTQSGNTVWVKGGLPYTAGAELSAVSVACAPSLSYAWLRPDVLCSFRCAYDLPEKPSEPTAE